MADLYTSQLESTGTLEVLERSTVIAVREHWWLPTRIDDEEWLDQGRGTPEAIDRSLADLGRINRWLGGMPTVCVCSIWELEAVPFRRPWRDGHVTPLSHYKSMR